MINTFARTLVSSAIVCSALLGNLSSQVGEVVEPRIDFAIELDIKRIRQVEALTKMPPSGTSFIDQFIGQFFGQEFFSAHLDRLIYAGNAVVDAQTGSFQLGLFDSNSQSQYLLRLEFEGVPAELHEELGNADSSEVEGKTTRYFFNSHVVETTGAIIEIKSNHWSEREFRELMSDELDELWQNLPAGGTLRFGYHVPQHPNWDTSKKISEAWDNLNWIQSAKSIALRVDLDGPILLTAAIETNAKDDTGALNKRVNLLLDFLRQYRQIALSEIPKHDLDAANTWLNSIATRSDDTFLSLDVARLESIGKVMLGFRKAFGPEFLDPATLVKVHLDFDIVQSKPPNEIIIRGKSNLPSGTVLDISIRESKTVGSIFGTEVTKSATVDAAGMFETVVKSDDPFKTGNYDVAVATAWNQPTTFSKKLGENGKLMSGPLVGGNSKSGKSCKKFKRFELRPPLTDEQKADIRKSLSELADEMKQLNQTIRERLEGGLLGKSQQHRARIASTYGKRLEEIRKRVDQVIIDHEIAPQIAACYSQLAGVIDHIEKQNVASSVPRHIIVMQNSVDRTMEHVVEKLK